VGYNKYLVIIGGGAMCVPVILAARDDFGLKTLVVDGDADCPGSRLADIFYHMSIYDPDEIASNIKSWNHHLDYVGVVTNGTDAAEAVYATAEALKLPGIPLSVARTVQNKYLSRQFIHDAGLSRLQPRWLYSKDDASYFEIKKFMDLIGGAVVIKPVGQRASRGVSLVNSPREIIQAMQYAKQFSNELLIEERIIGDEYNIEGLLDHGIPMWFNAVRRIFDYSTGHPIETGHINPAPESAIVTKSTLAGLWITAANVLGVTQGPFKVDAIVTEHGYPYLLETACRQSGGWDSQLTVPLSSGCRPIHANIALATGQPCDDYIDATGEQRFAACAALLPKVGRVVSIDSGLLELDIPSIDVRLSVKVGDVVSRQHCGDRAGFVIVTGSTGDEAWHRAQGLASIFSHAIETEIVDE
jgi:biotin carboxylase